MNTRLSSAAALVVATIFSVFWARPAPAGGGEEARAATVAQLAASPTEFRDARVVVTGWLQSVGANYFTDLRIVLMEPEGSDAFIYVRPWLPVELPPSPPGATAERPPVLSDYLDRMVELTAIVGYGPLKNVGTAHYLAVESARLLDRDAQH